MSSRRRVLGIVVAVVLAVFGTLALVAYVNGAEDRALAGERVVDVYVVTQPIAAGTSSDELVGKVKREQVPAKVQASGSVRKLGDIDGTVAAVDLVAGEQLLRARFADPTQAASQRSVGGSRIPAGWFQTTVQLDPAQALGGRVKAGQRITVVASVSSGVSVNGPQSAVVARDALVTNVQIDGDKGDDVNPREVTNAPTGKFLVTIALPQAELERVVYATDQGKVWLATEPGAR